MEAKWTQAARDEYFKEHPENFGDPDNQAFPVRDASDVNDAWNLAGHADAVRAKIKTIAKRLGFSDALPDTAKESVTLREANSPRSRIATMKLRWIKDNARSLNRRLYPGKTVDRLIASGQRKLSDPSAQPLTCFISHAAADNDQTQDLVGRITSLWREGEDGMCLIDFADTTVAENALGLVVGGYICTASLRAKNAELHTDPHYDMPVVEGDQIELEGIDLTNYPGLEHVARIQHVQIAESTKSAIADVFDITPQSVLLVKDNIMDKKDTELQETHKPEQVLTEDSGGNRPVSVPASGNTIGMTNDPPQDSYGQRMYQQPTMTSGPMQGNPSSGVDLQEAHDRIAMVQARECAPGRESVRWAMAYLKMTERERGALVERGRSLSAMNDSHLDKAHDAIARHTKMACEGAKNKQYDPDHDGDGDNTNDTVKNPETDQMESAKKASSSMTKDEALKLLEAQGYTVQIERKKTETEVLQEQLAKQAQQIEELRGIVSQPSGQNEPNPQRKSMVLGANTDGNRGSIRGQLYQHGKYLREQINKADWQELADRTCPLPEGLELDYLIKEFEQLYAVQYDDQFKILSATELR